MKESDVMGVVEASLPRPRKPPEINLSLEFLRTESNGC